MTNILEIDSVQLSFGERMILNSIYLKSETGKVTGVLGRNGCGKSSLFKMIFGEMKNGEKSVRLNDITLFEDARNPKEIRMLPQFNFLPKYLKVRSLFESFNQSYPEFCDVFEDFSLFENYRIGQLSGGNIRIIEVYLILMSESKFCILDEPFSHLSPKQTNIFLDLIDQEKNNKGVIVSDQQFKHIIDISDDLYLIKDGVSCRIENVDKLVEYGYLKK